MPRILSLVDPATTDYLPAARTIYESAFELEEKVPFERLWDAAHTSAAEIRVHFWGLLEGEELLGTAWFCTVPEERLGYLGYIAVAAAGRGRGYGETLMQAVLAEIKDLLKTVTGQPPLAAFWEVRSLEDAPDEAEYQLRQRRIRFYQRFGAEPLSVDYLCPPVAPGQPEVRFTLMAVTYPPGQPLPAETLRRIALTGLVKMEGADPQGEYVQRALASIL
jgi:GNAT superfamily N-acetyltransferase